MRQHGHNPWVEGEDADPLSALLAMLVIGANRRRDWTAVDALRVNPRMMSATLLTVHLAFNVTFPHEQCAQVQMSAASADARRY
jgi:hypothetical protein